MPTGQLQNFQNILYSNNANYLSKDVPLLAIRQILAVLFVGKIAVYVDCLAPIRSKRLPRLLAEDYVTNYLPIHLFAQSPFDKDGNLINPEFSKEIFHWYRAETPSDYIDFREPVTLTEHEDCIRKLHVTQSTHSGNAKQGQVGTVIFPGYTAPISTGNPSVPLHVNTPAIVNIPPYSPSVVYCQTKTTDSTENI